MSILLQEAEKALVAKNERIEALEAEVRQLRHALKDREFVLQAYRDKEAALVRLWHDPDCP